MERLRDQRRVEALPMDRHRIGPELENRRADTRRMERGLENLNGAEAARWDRCRGKMGLADQHRTKQLPLDLHNRNARMYNARKFDRQKLVKVSDPENQHALADLFRENQRQMELRKQEQFDGAIRAKNLPVDLLEKKRRQEDLLRAVQHHPGVERRLADYRQALQLDAGQLDLAAQFQAGKGFKVAQLRAEQHVIMLGDQLIKYKAINLVEVEIKNQNRKRSP